MPCLVFLKRFSEEERSPVCQTADYAAVGEDEGAGCAGNSGEGAMLVEKERQLRSRIGVGGGTL